MNPSITSWRIEYKASNPGNIDGLSSIILNLNRVPSGGTCTIDQTTGIALSTYFAVSCSNWIDTDGNITKYELNGI
jgi:hypothetical protein